MPQGGDRGQNLGHLKNCCCVVVFLLLSFSYVSFKLKEQVLFRVDYLLVTSDCRFFCLIILRNS